MTRPAAVVRRPRRRQWPTVQASHRPGLCTSGTPRAWDRLPPPLCRPTCSAASSTSISRCARALLVLALYGVRELNVFDLLTERVCSCCAVHGDEPVGREVLMQLANWLCDNYQNDPLATSIVENTHLHILPTMNPDGCALGRRGNANNVDLNRDFPDQFFSINDEISYGQPETRAIMNWIKQEHFTASASLHGVSFCGQGNFANAEPHLTSLFWFTVMFCLQNIPTYVFCASLYPTFIITNKQYYGCPDDKTFWYMASVYSQSHYNMSLSKEFKGGITNGAFWYPIYGVMQDWNYIHGGCFELTLEISDVKWPKAAELPVIWKHK